MFAELVEPGRTVLNFSQTGKIEKEVCRQSLLNLYKELFRTQLMELFSLSRVSLVLVSSCNNTGSIRDSYWICVELIEVSV
jgi:hypothetical protein